MTDPAAPSEGVQILRRILALVESNAESLKVLHGAVTQLRKESSNDDPSRTPAAAPKAGAPAGQEVADDDWL